MKRLSFILALAALSGFSFAQEAAYTIHVDFKTGHSQRCLLVPTTTTDPIWFIGRVDVGALFTLEQSTSLGVALGKSGPLTKNSNQIRWHGGLSVFDSGGSSLNLQVGGYVGIGWRF